MPISVVLYIFDGRLDGPELIQVSSEHELAHLLELQIELSELNGFGLIPLTPLWVDEVEYLFYFSVSDERAFYKNLRRILVSVANDFGLPLNTLTPDKNHTIPLTA